MQEKREILPSMWKKGTDFLNTKYAIMGGAMSWVSEHNFVAAISGADAFGVLATSTMPLDMIRYEIQKVRSLTSKPFGVNIILMRPDLDEILQVCIEEKVTHVVLAAGIPPASIIKKLSQENIKTMAFAPSLTLAQRLVKQGVDALIIEGSEAGGHIGSVSTLVLAQEILPHITSIPVFVAGGIGSGEAITSFLRMGAAGIQLGTALVCADECKAHKAFKKAFIKANARDAMPSVQIDPDLSVIPVRAIQNQGTKEFMQIQRDLVIAYKQGDISKKEAILKIENFWAGSLRRAVVDGDVKHGSLMAGQSVGLVTQMEPMKDIIERFVDQAQAHI